MGLRSLAQHLQTSLLRRCSHWLGQGTPARVRHLEAVLPQPLLRQLIGFWLFERSSRPGDRTQQLELLKWIHQAKSASLEQRRYALVALAYRAVDADDQDLAADCLAEINTLIAEAADRCRRGEREGRNRENPVKWLVSLHTTAYHLGLVLDQPEATMHRLGELDGLVSDTVMGQLEDDVACRLSSNLMRCLSLSWLKAWEGHRIDRMLQLRQRLEQLEQDLLTRHGNHPRQVFHRRVAETLLTNQRSLETDGGLRALERQSRELVRSPNPALPARLVNWFTPPTV